MTLPLPNLDDRRWDDLVEEGRGLIPQYAPDWTDHNLHDPGITLIELLAYVTEQELFRLNAIGEAHRRAFLNLAGQSFRPRGPQPAAMILVPDPGGAATGTIYKGDLFVPKRDTRTPALADPKNLLPSLPPRYRACHDLSLTGFRLGAVQAFDGRGFVDQTASLARGQTIWTWGEDPLRPESLAADRRPALYLGIITGQSKGDLKATKLTLWFVREDDPRGKANALVTDDQTFLNEQSESWPTGPCLPKENSLGRRAAEQRECEAHPGGWPHRIPGATICWEWFDGSEWRTSLDSEVIDETASFTRSGRVVLPLYRLKAKASIRLGAVSQNLLYVRARLASGYPDAAPRFRRIHVDAVLAEQVERSSSSLKSSTADPATLTLSNLQLSDSIVADLSDWDAELRRRQTPRAAWQTLPMPASKLQPDRQWVEWQILGVATGEPSQTFRFAFPEPEPAADQEEPGPPAQVRLETLRVATIEPSKGWLSPSPDRLPVPWITVDWERRDELSAGRRQDRIFQLVDGEPLLTMGDGEHGRVAPPGSIVLADYEWTAGHAGNVRAGFAWTLAGPGPGRPNVTFRNPDPSVGGEDPESLGQAEYRLTQTALAHETLLSLSNGTLDTIAPEKILATTAPNQAITTQDYERLAFAAPGRTVRRARAWAAVDPALDGMIVPGAVTVVVLPELPATRPAPTPELLRAVGNFLNHLRPIGSRVIVAGPEYLAVRVQAVIHVRRGTASGQRALAEQRIRDFLHPLRGGSAAQGWPFGRDLHVNEVLKHLQGLPGVQFVTGLKLAISDADWQTDPIRLRPRALIDLTDVCIDLQEDA